MDKDERSSHPDEVLVNLDTLVPDDDDHAFDSKLVEEVTNAETPPDFFSEEWHDYVMRQFRDDELENGHPFRDGLMRVTEKLIGPVIRREIVNFEGANESNRGSATVHVKLTIAVSNERHPLYERSEKFGDMLIEDGIAEVNSRNTPHPFFQHPAATASSKAEAQALRKALRLRKVVAADEITPEDIQIDSDIYMPDLPIVAEQITVLDLLCKRTNISVLEFINSGQSKFVFVEQIPSSKAQNMIKYLNEIQSGRKESPVNTPYDPAWREKNHKRANNESTT